MGGERRPRVPVPGFLGRDRLGDVITTFPVVHLLLECLIWFYLCLSEIHIFFGGGGGSDPPGLKLINQPGFTFRRPPEGSCTPPRSALPARSRRAPVVESVSGAEPLGEPSGRAGNGSEYADASLDAFNPLSPGLSPPLAFPTPRSLEEGATSSLAGLLDEGDFGSLSSRC